MIDVKKADCNELMASMGGGEIDLIVTDPPYLFGSLQGGGIGGKRAYMKDIQKMDYGVSDECLDEFLRVLKKPNMYLWGNWKLIQRYIAYFQERDISSNLLCWHKSNPPPLCGNKYLTDTEYCLYVRGKGVPLYGGYEEHHTYWITPLNQKEKAIYGHPTIKPLPIISRMVENSSQAGDIVFDPFLGSGTTAVACKLLNRNFIGCEIDEKYIHIINKRLAEIEPMKKGIDSWV